MTLKSEVKQSRGSEESLNLTDTMKQNHRCSDADELSVFIETDSSHNNVISEESVTSCVITEQDVLRGGD